MRSIETLYRQISNQAIPVGLLALGSLRRLNLPSEVDLESGYLTRRLSPITAAGPPRNLTVFRDTGTARVFTEEEIKCKKKINCF